MGVCTDGRHEGRSRSLHAGPSSVCFPLAGTSSSCLLRDLGQRALRELAGPSLRGPADEVLRQPGVCAVWRKARLYIPCMATTFLVAMSWHAFGISTKWHPHHPTYLAEVWRWLMEFKDREVVYFRP